MSETWFIGDTHFFHGNILKYEAEKRPFKDLKEMHEALIERWNSVVRDRDVVYHLGDFAMGRYRLDIASKLNGTKRLVLGNHDHSKIEEYAKYFKSIHGCVEWNRGILTHLPVHESQFFRYRFNIHGHMHSKEINRLEKQGWRYINVSCERNNLYPLNAHELMKMVKQREEDIQN